MTSPTKRASFEGSPYNLSSPVLEDVKMMLKHCIELLLGDIPRIRWRFDGGCRLVYTPDYHGAIVHLHRLKITLTNVLEYKTKRHVFRMYFGRDQMASTYWITESV